MAAFAVWCCSFALAAGATAAEECFRVVIHDSNEIAGIAVRDLEMIFLKRISRWPDGTRVVPVDQAPESPVRASFSAEVLGKSATAIDRYWQKVTLMDRGRVAPPDEVASDREVLEFVYRRRGAVGYVGCGSLPEPGVRVLDLLSDDERVTSRFDRRAEPPAVAEADARSVSAEDTPLRRRHSETRVVRAFRVGHAAAGDVGELLGRLLKLEHVAVSDDHHVVLVRATAAQIESAAALVRTVDRPRAEIELDVALLLLEGRRLGVLRRAGGGEHLPRRLDAGELERLRETARSLAEPGLAVLDRDTARWRMREDRRLRKGTAGAAGTEPDMVETGLALSVRPLVHAKGDVTLEVMTAWTDLVGEGADAELAVRTFAGEASARLRPGETLLASGLLPPAAERGRLARSLGSAADSEMVLALTPRVVRGRELPEEDVEIICAAAGDPTGLCEAAADEQP